MLRAKRGTGGHQAPSTWSFETPGTRREAQRKAKSPLSGSWLPSPAHPRGSAAPLLWEQRRAGRQCRQGVYSTAKHRDEASHDPQLPRGQCWGQMEGEGSRADAHDGHRDPTAWVGGAMQRGDKSHGEGKCGRCGMPQVGPKWGTGTAFHRGRAPEGNEVTCCPGPGERDEQV